MSNSLDPDKALTECGASSGPKLFAKGYQQMTKSGKGLTQSQNISVQLVITFKVTNSLDPNKALTEYRPDLGPNCLQRVISR